MIHAFAISLKGGISGQLSVLHRNNFFYFLQKKKMWAEEPPLPPSIQVYDTLAGNPQLMTELPGYWLMQQAPRALSFFSQLRKM